MLWKARLEVLIAGVCLTVHRGKGLGTWETGKSSLSREGAGNLCKRAAREGGPRGGRRADVCLPSACPRPPPHPLPADDIPDVCIVERLFSSSLVVVVSHTKPRQMNVYHFKKGTEICSYSYSSNVLSIRLNRQVRGWRIPPGHKAPAAGDQGKRGASLGMVISLQHPALSGVLKLRPRITGTWFESTPHTCLGGETARTAPGPRSFRLP